MNSHCVHCDRTVRPVKKASLITIAILVVMTIFWTLIGVPLLLIYGVYYVFFKSRECPICRGKDFTLTEEQTAEEELLDSMKMSNVMKK